MAQIQALGPGETRKAEVVRGLLARYEAQGRTAFLKQAMEVLLPLQVRILQDLAGNLNHLLTLNATHTRDAAQALADRHVLLMDQRRIVGCLAYQWGTLALVAPWSEWRGALGLPRACFITEFHDALGVAAGGPLPDFLEWNGPGRLRFVLAGERERLVAARLGVDLDGLVKFTPKEGLAMLAERRAKAQERRHAQELKEAAELAALALQKQQRAEAHRKRQAEQQAVMKARQLREQADRRAAAAWAKELRKADRERQIQERQREAQEAKVQREREDAARQAADAQRAAEVKRAKALRRVASRAERSADRKAAEPAAVDQEPVPAPVLQAVEHPTVPEAETDPKIEQARRRAELERRGLSLLRLPRNPPLSAAMEARVQAALERHRRELQRPRHGDTP